MSSDNSPPRLAVVAAIIGAGRGTGTIESAARLGSRFRAAAQDAAVARATPAERELAEALSGGDRGSGNPGGEPVMAQLLLLAGDAGDTGELAIGLSRAFVGTDGAGPAVTRDRRASAFADLYRKVTLHQLNNQVRNKAAAILGRLRGR